MSRTPHSGSLLPGRLHATGEVNGFQIRPGLFLSNGATLVPGGVSFTIHSFNGTACELCLFHQADQEPFAVLPFPEECRMGGTYFMIVFDLDIQDIEYAYRMDGPCDPVRGLIFDRTKFLLDPYARAVTVQSIWAGGERLGRTYHARVVEDTFDWGPVRNPRIPFSDMIIYEMRVRGFTKHASSQVKFPGTFAGLEEKIPYLLELGVNAVELMPVFEFDEKAEERVERQIPGRPA